MQKSMTKKYGHLWENAAKMMPKRGPKSITLQSVFLHDQGFQKSIKTIKNPCKMEKS